MAPPRKYPSNAAKQRAYRQRLNVIEEVLGDTEQLAGLLRKRWSRQRIDRLVQLLAPPERERAETMPAANQSVDTSGEWHWWDG